MTVFVALLRAVNLGGSTTLPMASLRAWAEAEGFENVRTWIASGNLIVESPKSEGEVKARLEAMLKARTGRAVGVVVRSAAEIGAVLQANPFKSEPGNLTVALFLDVPPPAGSLDNISGAVREEVRPGAREFYVWYPDGQGRSKLKIPAAKDGTARNMNTVAKLVDMSGS